MSQLDSYGLTHHEMN